MVIEKWKTKGCPQWNYETTKNECLKVDSIIAKRSQNPAPRFREEIGNKNNSYIRRWVRECHFDCLNPRDKPKTHDIKKLGKLVAAQEPKLLEVFPKGTEEKRNRFELLRKAYVDARYDDDYKISRKELQWLGARVKKLWVGSNLYGLLLKYIFKQFPG